MVQTYSQWGGLLASLPPKLLAQLPALTPPPGIKSNFVKPYSRGYVLVTVSSILASLMILLYSYPSYVVLLISPTASDIDLLQLGAILLYVTTVLSATPGGTVGIHQWDIPLSKVFERRNLIVMWIPTFAVSFSLGFVKLSIFLVYLETFVGLRWMRIAVYIGATISSVFYLIMTFAQLYYGTPLHGETFAEHIFTNRSITGTRWSVPMSCVGLGIDCYLFILPLIATSKLRLPMRKKVVVMLMFGVASLAIMGSILSIVYRVEFNQNDDVTFNLLNVNLVLTVELYIGIMLCCSPPMRIFFRRHRKGVSRAPPLIAACLCRRSRSTASVHPTHSTDAEKQDALTPPAAAKIRQPKLYPGLDITSPSNLERADLRGALSSGAANSMEIQTDCRGGAHSIPSTELRQWA
ncbi:hypothetical protein DSL72_006593 [Monilinia vaccinii-corymbosi]|uniref:Rhodopsin domain-containing protein n=1 Tax=Monilinia vaccinii-corymbosi TaxID=61207 RepID=A0A8A3PNJ1_9HELO|nr:hypothetical protein DSL72_006593 [Monilinia vaccinii-corymbosi]